MHCALKKHVVVLVLGVLLSVPSMVCAKSYTDSLLLNRVFTYKQMHIPDTGMQRSNVYTKFSFDVIRRNVLMWLIPTTYTIAHGDRQLLLESYGKMTYGPDGLDDVERQAVWGTVPRMRRVMPTLQELLAPTLYKPSLLSDHVLSPFHHSNRHYYRYHVQPVDRQTSRILFSPRFRNTQLISGYAVVETHTGRIVSSYLNGEFDMIRFRTITDFGRASTANQFELPSHSKTEAEFRFLGNHVKTAFETVYGCSVSLPDSVSNEKNRELIDSLRPLPLTPREDSIYACHYGQQEEETVEADTTETPATTSKSAAVRDFFVDVGDNLVSSIRARSDKGYLRLSPILNPQYLSYSKRNGIAYKMKLNADYHFNAHRYFEFRAQAGYNFKQHRFYYTAPLRFYYNPKRNGYVDVVFGNGNRISHSSVVDEIRQERGDSIDLPDELEYFDDSHLTISNNIMVFDWIDIETGVVYHRRKAVDASLMRQMGKSSEYRSFAPMVSITLRPVRHGPVLHFNYERGLKNVNGSDLDYERCEIDGVTKYYLGALTTLNVRVGGGFYTRRHDTYFLDYANFRANNLPEGWDDDWTGNFQLLDSRLYNESKRYLRSNLSLDTPVLLSPFIPIFGKTIERERLYLSSLALPSTRPYHELGYGLTNRYLSVALFASFMNININEVGCKFTIELFHRW